ncbi:HAMP domain-containing histidine kinase [Cellulophaga sp. F20128]|uniref:sensor histidine kinase n=1 Tax=Cellulophaga sp. F20128 TaxID=2926413 RepID=UPI001FF252A5|nr:ATP-binding protein [Cellulophaga sp. F20128]MCK0158118.1 HAMP domain-containing histidine kinase [Cellulophaga sp. F20128]
MIQKWWKSYIVWYANYSGFNKRNREEGLPYFRDKLFISIQLLTLILGAISYIPSTYTALSRNENNVFYINTTALVILLFTIFYRPLNYKIKKFIFSLNFILLAFGLLVFLGFRGNGSVLIYMITIMITLYNGRSAGLKAVLLAAVFYVILLLSFNYNLFHLPIYEQFEPQVLMIIIINNILFNLLIVFSVSFLINQLHNALLKENKLQQELLAKHNNAVTAMKSAEKSDRLKSAFLANVSHEIGTPMYGILGCTDFLKEYNTDDVEYQEYVALVEENGTTLLEIIADIVNISKVETGLAAMTTTAFNVNEVIDEAYSSLLPKAAQKQISFTKNNLVTRHEAMIHSDKGKLTEVLKHLLKNAIKYTQKGGVDLKCYATNKNTIEFQIEDSGMGIPKDQYEAIFEAFYQVDTDHRKALHGSGIGLAIAKAYTEMLGGTISLKKNNKMGTTFTFSIRTQL